MVAAQFEISSESSCVVEARDSLEEIIMDGKISVPRCIIVARAESTPPNDCYKEITEGVYSQFSDLMKRMKNCMNTELSKRKKSASEPEPEPEAEAESESESESEFNEII